ncbi:MAG: toxic anion resistance protein [Lachnospiraceae bacterium]
MDVELKDKDIKLNDSPTLTFEPFLENVVEEKEETDVGNVQPEKKEVPVFDESLLSEEERRMVDDFVQKIDITNSNLVLQYGAGAQKKIADFSDSALNNIKTKDLGEVGELLTGVVAELKSFDVEEEEKGLFGFFKKTSNKLTNMRAKYEKAEVSVNRICKVLEDHQVQLMKDVAMLDKMYELNKVYFKELSMYILAGKKKLAKIEAEELPKIVQRASESGLPEDAQAANDLSSLCNRFEKKIHDLELTRMVSIQMAPQIRLVQSNDTLMSEKIQSTLVNTIPLWKGQMVLALGVTHSQQAARAQREVTDMTNELLRKNAATLKLATVETAKESERGVVDIETLKMTNESLISTLDEVLRIQTEGRNKRKEAEVELNRIEDELKRKLLQMRG